MSSCVNFIYDLWYDYVCLSPSYKFERLECLTIVWWNKQPTHPLQEFLEAASAPIASQSNGVFLDSCLIHCQSLNSKSWNGYKVKGQTMRETFADWYFDRSGEDKEVDCAYPCNLSC